MQRLILALLIAFTAVLASAQDEPALPDMGSSAAALLSPEQARYIGQSMLSELRRQNAVLDDPLLDDYLSGLGYRLVAHSEQPDQRFVFFVVRSSAINAFAAPGGYVGVNAGLITTAVNESELAAVIAHEVAHVTQQHIVRAVENIRNASIPIMLAMLGALIAAQASNSSSSGEAAEAAIIGGQALIQQQQINFTRHNEYEADRIGIHTLSRSGFEPIAMANFFARMGLALRANGEGPPEFLRTHPVSTSRISEAKNRAANIERSATAAKSEARDPLLFALMRERARALSDLDPAALLEFYRRDRPEQAHARLAFDYGQALALLRAGRADEAAARLARLAEMHPEIVAFELGRAEAEQEAGNAKRALDRLAAAHRRHPDNRAVAIAYADTLTETGREGEARQAMDVLRPLLTGDPDNLALYLAFARACELAGEEIRAGEAHAEVALLNGRFDDALGQLGNLLRRTDVDYYQRARIEARMAQITPLALEERRRRNPLVREAG